MFVTKLLVPLNHVPSYDAQITRQLDQPALNSGFGHEMVVALETPSGDVYREVRAFGVRSYVRLCLMLRQQGLQDNPRSASLSGYSSRFRPK